MSDTEEFEGYVTKYALTGGVQKMTLVSTSIDGMVCDKKKGYASPYHGEGREWHRTYASAHKQAEKMRVKKIASLTASIEKLATPFPDTAT